MAGSHGLSLLNDGVEAKVPKEERDLHEIVVSVAIHLVGISVHV